VKTKIPHCWKYIFRFSILLILAIYILPQYYYVLEETNHYQLPPQLTKFESGKVGIFLINLDRSKERLSYAEKFTEELSYDFNRVPAIDGNLLNPTELDQLVDLESYKKFLGHTPNLGTIGCSLSHFKALETFLNSNNEFALILEDDVSFDPQELSKVIDFSVKSSHLWDVVNFEISHRGFPLTLKKYDSNHRLSVYLTEITHAGAYLINRSFARKLLEKSLPIKMPLDYYFTRSWEFDAKFTGIENPRVVFQTFGDSEIRSSNKLEQEHINLVDKINRSIAKFQSYLIRAVYNLKIYFLRAD